MTSTKEVHKEEQEPLPYPALEARNLSAWYGDNKVLEDINISIPESSITALIGPSGSGKSTLLRTFNRMHELTPNTRVSGTVLFYGENIYDSNIDATMVRQKIGMVFQKPNPLPKSIYENVAFALKINGHKGSMDEVIEDALTKAALWNEVKDRLKQSAFTLSGGQQQRLCIARALAVQPSILLMDEPSSSLDPPATVKIEELMQDLKKIVSIVIVTHNIQQAGRVSDFTAFLFAEHNKPARLVESGKTSAMFKEPKEVKTQEYMSGRFG